MIPFFKAYDNQTHEFYNVTMMSWKPDKSILQIEVETPNGKEYRRFEDIELIVACNGCELG